MAGILKGVGFGAETVGRALRDVYDIDDRAVAGVLKRAGYTADQIARAVRDIFGTTRSAIESWGDEVGDFFDGVLGSISGL